VRLFESVNAASINALAAVLASDRERKRKRASRVYIRAAGHVAGHVIRPVAVAVARMPDLDLRKR
jgi:hypothetical protein